MKKQTDVVIPSFNQPAHSKAAGLAAFVAVMSAAVLAGCNGTSNNGESTAENGTEIAASSSNSSADTPVGGSNTAGGAQIPAGSNTPTPPLGGPAPAPTPTETPPPAATNPNLVGESCISSDPNRLCLAIHFVTYQDSAKVPVADKAQTAVIIKKMNQLFATCNIGFQVENYEVVDPANFGLAYGSQSQSQTDLIRDTFTTTNDELLAVSTGPWGTAVNAWTNMPGGGPYGAVMEASIVDYGDGIIYAHEFGHYLGLDHASSSTNLMSPVIATNSTALTASQCDLARSTIHSYWSAMIRK